MQGFEDNLQRRDFVSVHDVARACQLALETPAAEGQVFNIGSGQHYSILDIARMTGEVLQKSHIQPEVSGQYRVGDIRHCFADISKASEILGYQPEVSIEKGLEELARWLEHQEAEDKVDVMRNELSSRGLSV